MALLFQRLAHNFVKNGYFPTDEVTITSIMSALDTKAQKVRLLDPCCGEGTALAEIKQGLVETGATVNALGIEFDAERAWHAKTILDSVNHADIHDVRVSHHSVGLLFLNPPYGAVVTDSANTGDRNKGDRLEKVFCRKSFQSLQFGGVLVLIIPYYVLDEEFARLISRNFDQVTIHKCVEERFKQLVIMGVKRRSDGVHQPTVASLLSAKSGEVPYLPVSWTNAPYEVPSATPEAQFCFVSERIDAKQLSNEVRKFERSTLWPRFGLMFNKAQTPVQPPLRNLSKWHLALALAAGCISGFVESSNGRRLLIKGGTIKQKRTTVEYADSPEGGSVETRIATDVFVPTIRVIDFTPGEQYGNLFTIR